MIQRLLREFAALFEVRPDAADNLNVDRYVQEVVSYVGAPSDVLLSEDQVQQLRQQRMQQQAMQQAPDAVAKGARGAKDLSQADVGSDNGLTRALAALGGPASAAGGMQGAA